MISTAGSGRHSQRWSVPPRAELIGPCRYYADPPTPEHTAFSDARYWVRLFYCSNDDSDAPDYEDPIVLSQTAMENEPKEYLVATNLAELAENTHNAPGGYTLLWETRDEARGYRYFIDVDPGSPPPKLVKAIYDQREPTGEAGSYYLTVDVVEVSGWPFEDDYVEGEGSESFIVHLPFTWGVNWPNVGSGDYFFVERMKANPIDGSGGGEWWVPTHDSYLDGTIGSIILWNDPDNIKRGWGRALDFGKFLVTLDEDDPDFDTVGKTGGYKHHGPDENNHDPHNFYHHHLAPGLCTTIYTCKVSEDPNGIDVVQCVNVQYSPTNGVTSGPTDCTGASIGTDLIHAGGPIPFDSQNTTSNLPPYTVVTALVRVKEPLQP